MARFPEMLDSKNICDVALSVGGYNYYGYQDREGAWAIMRENTAETEYRYAYGGKDYSTAWTNKTVNVSFGIPYRS